MKVILIQIITFNILFYVYGYFVCLCGYLVPQEARREHESLWNLNYGLFLHMWVLGLKRKSFGGAVSAMSHLSTLGNALLCKLNLKCNIKIRSWNTWIDYASTRRHELLNENFSASFNTFFFTSYWLNRFPKQQFSFLNHCFWLPTLTS